MNFTECFSYMYWEDHVCGGSHWLIRVCWTIFVNLGLIPLGCGLQSFQCVVGLGLLVFCWKLLHVYASKVLFCYFLFWWYLCFWYQSDGNFIEWTCFLLFSLWEEFEKVWYKFFFVRLGGFTHEAIWLWTFVCREFFLKLQISTSCLVINLFKLSISSWFKFGRLYV